MVACSAIKPNFVLPHSIIIPSHFYKTLGVPPVAHGILSSPLHPLHLHQRSTPCPALSGPSSRFTRTSPCRSFFSLASPSSPPPSLTHSSLFPSLTQRPAQASRLAERDSAVPARFFSSRAPSPRHWPSSSPPSSNPRHFFATINMAGSDSYQRKHKVAVIGAGNWGTTVAKIVAENTREHPDLFEEHVQMWVYEEEFQVPDGETRFGSAAGTKQKLSEFINQHHENYRYLPDIVLPANLKANPSLVGAAKDATLLIFNLPHEFAPSICRQLKGNIQPFARGISCIKGVTVTDKKVDLICEYLGDELGIYCGVLSGANIASEIAREQWCETTIAYNTPPEDKRAAAAAAATGKPQQHLDSHGRVSKTKLTPVPHEYPPVDHAGLEKLFTRPYLNVSMVHDVAGVSLGGALKNIVAIAAGTVDGSGYNMTAKTAVMRRGMIEIVQFGRDFFPETVSERTFWEESAGWGDMVVSCTEARNWRYSKMAAERRVSVQEIERTELKGQKLQGISTSRDVSSFLRARGAEDRYPLFMAVERILDGKFDMADLPKLFRK